MPARRELTAYLSPRSGPFMRSWLLAGEQLRLRPKLGDDSHGTVQGLCLLASIPDSERAPHKANHIFTNEKFFRLVASAITHHIFKPAGSGFSATFWRRSRILVAIFWPPKRLSLTRPIVPAMLLARTVPTAAIDPT